ncbi:MAG: GDP-mannose 4,6-dehydratase [Kosmotogaceae bacterium]|nr:GDP-mannose 4,6-dehydratase [Kosmotogaceae bacterium]
MKYFVTGITGFIGSELKNKLDGEVYGLVRWSHRKESTEGFIPIFGDLTNYNDILSIIKRIKPEVIINLGAITPVSMSFEKPFDYFDINTVGVVNLVEANRRVNPYLEKFIHASTPETYGIRPQPVTPDTTLEPNSPYAVSKAAADMYLQYAFRAYEFPSIMSRHANCYGRKDQNHFVVEAIVTQMLKGKDKIYLGDKEPKRDFMYVDDVVKFYKLLVEKGVPGNIYTAGWNQSPSIEDVVKTAKKVIGWEGEVVWGTIPKRPGEIPEIRLDPTKAEDELGWKPTITLEEGIRRTAEHWKNKI